MNQKRLTKRQVEAERFFVESMARKYADDPNGFFIWAVEKMFDIPVNRILGYLSEI